MPRHPKKSQKENRKQIKSWWLGLGGLAAGLVLVVAVWLGLQASSRQPKEAPEAQKILDLQAGMPFQILIPAYLPSTYDRENVEIDISEAGPGGEPMATLTYRSRKGMPLFIKQWVPVNPELETLAASRPIETKWGQGWLLKQGEGLIALWADIGPLRVSIYTSNQDILDQQHLLAVADNMGPASNRQVFNFVVDPPEVREIEPPPPVEIPVSTDGVQEVDLIVTPGGYSPLRFSVLKGVPVHLTFRQLGEVGCGNELNFPTSASNLASLRLADPNDKQELTFTPDTAGEFQFFCGHLMYRGVMTVREPASGDAP